ncbi:MAG: hypothetical protein HZB80_04945 [Deltaproteobacteria bacterium]|nr:hypothetical protein [Deltaproteobacteria bacterium]
MMILKIAISLLIVSALSSKGYAETDVKKIYNLREKEGLYKIIDGVEKKIHSEPSAKDSLKVLGIAYHNLAVLGMKGASDKAVEYLEKANQLSPEDYEVIAYLGSAKTMAARDSWNLFIKLSKVNDGINMMDRAVSKSPDNIAIRMVRANNSLKLPKFFGRRDIANKDFLHIEGLINAQSDIDSDIKAEVFYHLGMLYKEENEALSKGYFRKTIEASPNSKWGVEARKGL